MHGQLLGGEVDHEDRARHLAHHGDTAEVLLKLLELVQAHQALLGGQQLQLAFLVEAAQLVKTLNAVGDGAEVGQETTEPTMVDVRHTAAVSLRRDGVTGLLLRTDEQHAATLGGDVANHLVRLLGQHDRLLQIDHVDAATLAENEPAHLRIPASGLMTEVNSGLQQFSHADCSHNGSFKLGSSGRAPAGIC